MTRRLVAAIVAVLLATIGGILLLNYVSSADERAAAGVETTSVLVVATPVPQGTPSADLAAFVTAKSMPVSAVAPGAVTSLDELSGQVTTVDLQPGEQLLPSRFADPQSLRAPGTVTVPPDLQQVSVLLEPQRVLGGNITPGARVAIFVTTGEPPQTSLALSNVLVSNVQGGVQPTPPPQEGDPAAEPAPESPPPAPDAPPPPVPVPAGSVMVTFALSSADAQTLISSVEHGTIWLSLEPGDGQ